jgi:hypothetical protein
MAFFMVLAFFCGDRHDAHELRDRSRAPQSTLQDRCDLVVGVAARVPRRPFALLEEGLE